MMTKTLFSLILLSSALLLTKCTKVEYTNPIDPKGTNYIDSLADDDDGDGILNLWDNDFVIDEVSPIIEIKGDNPATIVLTEDEDAFWEEVEDLKKQFECYDEFDKDLNNSDAEIETNIYLAREGSNYEIKYKVKDKYGNSTTETRKVIVTKEFKDRTPPTIYILTKSDYLFRDDTFHIEKGRSLDYNACINAFDDDNVPFVFGENLIKEGSVDVNRVKVYKVKFTATDTTGNESDTTIFFNVYDNGNSDLNPATIIVFYDGKEIEDDYTFKDTVGNLKFDKTLLDYEVFVMEGDKKIDLNKDDVLYSCDYEAKKGDYTAEYRISHNEMQTSVIINIKVYADVSECKDLSITLKGESKIILDVGDDYNDPGCTVKEDGEEVLGADIIASPATIDTDKPCSVIVTYTVKNDCDKAFTTKRTVVVRGDEPENTPPVIKLKKSKAQDTVIIGTKYSDYKKTDLGNTAEDAEDDDLDWGDVEIDTTGFKTSKAGKGLCSLTYVVEDSDDEETKVVRKIVVIESASEGLLEKYGVPTSVALPKFNATFNVITVEGDVKPNHSNIKSLQFDWDLSAKKINYSAFSTTNGEPNWNIVITDKIDNTFGSANPKFTLEGSGTDLDGEYYVTYKDEKFIWVEVDGKYAIIWEE